MPITAEEVRHIAALARLDVPDGDIARLAGEMDRILTHVARLSEVDIEGVPPTSHALDVAGTVRPDAPVPSLERTLALRNAPSAQSGMFVVPLVVDDTAE